MSLISLKNLSKTYLSQSQERLEILKDLSLEIETGKSIALSGPSGSGKSTLTQILAGTLNPDQGEILWQPQPSEKQSIDLCQMNEDQRCDWRLHQVGFVFQDFRLFPHLTALENAGLSLELLGHHRSTLKDQLMPYFERFSLSHRLNHLPSMLSGGEQQRVAIIRAIAHQPALILADEPTGNLDRYTAQQVGDLLLSLPKNQNCSLLVVTHDLTLAEKCDLHYRVAAGKLILEKS
jgi:putative ABC transport system ATP-binding protein